MKFLILSFFAVLFFLQFTSCDHVENPYPKKQEFDTTLYPAFEDPAEAVLYELRWS